MTKEIFTAAVCMTTTSDKARNIATAESLVRSAAASGSEWIMLPEIFSWHGPYTDIFQNAETEDGPLNQKLAALARELKIVLFAGTVGERPGPKDQQRSDLVNSKGEKKVFNTSYVFGRDGSLVGKYRKTHLFNLIADDGTPTHCESDGFLAGDSAQSINVDGMKVGLSICYDLRFPEFYCQLAAGGPVDVIAIPSAFTLATGMYHWELLLRARAVEWQAYVIAANQTGVHSPGKASFGHAMVIDPWGHKLADTGNHPGIARAAISREKISLYRAQLPALANRRPEVYRHK
jgi:predicted amidohydrolase